MRDSQAVYGVRYHGTGGGLFVVVVKNLLLTIVTLGIYLPWARTERRKYLWQNLEFDGQRLRYHGTGREMLMGYLKVLVAYLAFLGLPAAVAQTNPKAAPILQVVLLFILLPLIPIAIYGSRRYLLSRTSLRGVRFGMDLGATGYLKVFLLGYLMTACTLGLYAPIWQNRLYRYTMERSRYGSEKFFYDGADNDAWKIGIKGFLLSVVTLGIYYPWYLAHIARFRADHTIIQGARARVDLTGGDMLRLLVVSILGTVLSLGIAFPWVNTYVMRTIASKTSFVGTLNYGVISAAETTGDATADGLADALDVGFEV